MQALAPASSISELFNIIYQFYRKNLECQYDETENAFQILSQNIQKKMFFITSRMRTGSAAPIRIRKQETPIQGGTACSGSGKICTTW